jgi:hypothetical protein
MEIRMRLTGPTKCLSVGTYWQQEWLAKGILATGGAGERRLVTVAVGFMK